MVNHLILSVYGPRVNLEGDLMRAGNVDWSNIMTLRRLFMMESVMDGLELQYLRFVNITIGQIAMFVPRWYLDVNGKKCVLLLMQKGHALLHGLNILQWINV